MAEIARGQRVGQGRHRPRPAVEPRHQGRPQPTRPHHRQLIDVDQLAVVDETGARPALTARLGRWAKAVPSLSDALAASYLSHAAMSRQLGSAGEEAP